MVICKFGESATLKSYGEKLSVRRIYTRARPITGALARN